MPYVEARSSTVKTIFHNKGVKRLAHSQEMLTNKIYLFTYTGRKMTQRRPLILCMGQKEAEKTGTKLVEGINLNYLTEVQGLVFKRLTGTTKDYAGGQFVPGGGRAQTGGDTVGAFDLMSAEDIATELSKHGDYKSFPLEKIYRTYDASKISDINEILM